MRRRCGAVLVVSTAPHRFNDNLHPHQLGRCFACKLSRRFKRRCQTVWSHHNEQLGSRFVVFVDSRGSVDLIRPDSHLYHATLLRTTGTAWSRVNGFKDTDDQPHPTFTLQQSWFPQTFQVKIILLSNVEHSSWVLFIARLIRNSKWWTYNLPTMFPIWLKWTRPGELESSIQSSGLMNLLTFWQAICPTSQKLQRQRGNGWQSDESAATLVRKRLCVLRFVRMLQPGSWRCGLLHERREALSRPGGSRKVESHQTSGGRRVRHFCHAPGSFQSPPGSHARLEVRM